MLGGPKSLMKRGGELVGGEGADTHTAPTAEARGLQQAQPLPALTVCVVALTVCTGDALLLSESLVSHGVMVITAHPDIMPGHSCTVPRTVR